MIKPVRNTVMNQEKRYVVAVDGPDPDNVIAVLLACKEFGPENVAVVLTGRKLQNGTSQQERKILEINAARFYSWLHRFGFDNVPIYNGGIAAFTPIPDEKHYDERQFNDIDHSVANKSLLPLRELLPQLADRFSVIVGGPMTGVRDLLQLDSGLPSRIDSLYAMYGSTGEAQLINAKQFNWMADEEAGKEVLEQLSQAGTRLVFAPTEATKDSSIAIQPDQLSTIFADPKLVDIYQKWYEALKAAALARRRESEPLFIHDIAPVLMAMSDEKNINTPAFETDSSQARILQADDGSLDLALGGSSGGIETRPERQGEMRIELARKPNPQVYFGVLRAAFKK